MEDKITARLQHAVIALFLAVGLVIPLSGALEETLISPRTLGIIAGIILVFEAVSFHRKTAWAAAGIAMAASVWWLFAGGGAQTLSDAGIAVTLRMNGIRTAIPLAANAVSLMIAVPGTLLCCFAALRKASCLPALLLCTAVLMIVWLTDSMQMIPWLLPALAAALTLLLVSRFNEPPALRVLPWAAGLTAAAYLLAGIGPADTPLREKADEIRQSVLDRLFFTEARDVFSLYSVGFSPQGPDQLGGRPTPSEAPVMQVSTPKPSYLRGAIYNRYTGHGWQNTMGGRRYLWQSGRMADIRSRLFDETLPPENIQNSLSMPSSISVRMLTGSASTLFVPQRVRELVPGGELVPYFSNASEIYVTRNLQAGDTYEVSAPLYSAGDPGIGTLTEICATAGDPRWNTVRETYLELPSHLEQPVRDLALKITARAEGPFEKAAALQNYLRSNYQYTLDVGEHPENVDFVTSFLLDTKKGYCTYFASAMTVLCRMVGIPARYVEGYLAEPDARGEALVTGMNAHAWTEVYFEGFGWLTFDATPGQQRSTAAQDPGGNQDGLTVTPEPTEEKTPEPTEEPTPTQEQDDSKGETPKPGETPTPEPETGKKTENNPEDPKDPVHPKGEESSSPDEPKPFHWWILIVLAIVAAAGIRVWITGTRFREKRARTEAERFDIWAGEIELLLKAADIERKPGETPIAFARRIDREDRFSESLMPAGEGISMIRYSRKEPKNTDTELMRDTALLLHGEIGAGARIRYFARRFFRSHG